MRNPSRLLAGLALIVGTLVGFPAVHAQNGEVPNADTCQPPATRSCNKAAKSAEYAIRWDPTTQPAAPQTLKATLSALNIDTSLADDPETRKVTYYSNVDRAGLEVPDPNSKAIVRYRDGAESDLTYKLRGGCFSCLCPFGDDKDFEPSLECDVTVVGSPGAADSTVSACRESFSCALQNADKKDAKKYFGPNLVKHEADMERVEYKPEAQKKLKIEAWRIGGVLRILEVSQNGDDCALSHWFLEHAVAPLLAAGVTPGKLSKEELVTGAE